MKAEYIHKNILGDYLYNMFLYHTNVKWTNNKEHNTRDRYTDYDNANIQ